MDEFFLNFRFLFLRFSFLFFSFFPFYRLYRSLDFYKYRIKSSSRVKNPQSKMKHARSDAHRAHKAHKARPTGTERIIGATCATCATPGPLTAVPIATTDLTLLVEAMLRTIRALALTAPGPQAPGWPSESSAAMAAALNSLIRLTADGADGVDGVDDRPNDDDDDARRRDIARDIARAAGALDLVYTLLSSPAASVALNGLNGQPKASPSSSVGRTSSYSSTDVVLFSIGLLCALLYDTRIASASAHSASVHSASVHSAHSSSSSRFDPLLREFVTRGATRDIRRAADTALILLPSPVSVSLSLSNSSNQAKPKTRCVCSAVADGDTAAVMAMLVADRQAREARGRRSSSSSTCAHKLKTSATAGLGPAATEGRNLKRRRTCLCPHTPLSLSVYAQPWDRDMTAMLLAYGADPNERNWGDDSVPLHWCEEEPDARALLLRAGANPDVRDSIGATPVERHASHARLQALAAAGRPLTKTEL